VSFHLRPSCRFCVIPDRQYSTESKIRESCHRGRLRAIIFSIRVHPSHPCSSVCPPGRGMGPCSVLPDSWLLSFHFSFFIFLNLRLSCRFCVICVLSLIFLSVSIHFFRVHPCAIQGWAGRDRSVGARGHRSRARGLWSRVRGHRSRAPAALGEGSG